MAKENPFKKALRSRKEEEPQDEVASVEELPVQSEAQTVQHVEPLPEFKEMPAEPKKRGRPATGKRSDTNWIGRTFYIQKETDFDVEAELLDIKRQGIELDKSELVERLLAAWVKWRNGENLDIQMFEISPRRKSN